MLNKKQRPGIVVHFGDILAVIHYISNKTNHSVIIASVSVV